MRYTREIVAGIITNCGGLPPDGEPEKLGSDLEGAAVVFEMWGAVYGGPPSDVKRLKIFGDIGKLAERLSKGLGTIDSKDIRDTKPFIFSALVHQAAIYAAKTGPYPEFSPTPYNSSVGGQATDYGETEAVLNASQAVWRLYQWAKAERKEAEKALLTDTEGPSDQAWLVAIKLPEIYERHFKKRFGVSKPGDSLSLDEQSRSRSEPYGPGIRFVQAALAPLGISKSPDAIEKAWDRSRHKWDIKSKK